MADLGLLIEYEYFFERILYFYSFTFVSTTVYFCSKLDISSCDLPAKDTARYTEDQVTMETNKEHSMNNGEQFLAVTIVTHQRGKRKPC